VSRKKENLQSSKSNNIIMAEHRNEANEYIKTHRLDELMGNLTSQLAFNQPGTCSKLRKKIWIETKKTS